MYTKKKNKKVKKGKLIFSNQSNPQLILRFIKKIDKNERKFTKKKHQCEEGRWGSINPFPFLQNESARYLVIHRIGSDRPSFMYPECPA